MNGLDCGSDCGSGVVLLIVCLRHVGCCGHKLCELKLPNGQSRTVKRLKVDDVTVGEGGRMRKVVILAGGLGSRLSEETDVRPKPMVEIGGWPILWHIMKIYSHYGLNDFIICLGYRGYVIKEFFANYHIHMADVTFDFSQHSTVVHRKRAEPWRVTLVETGDTTMTGGRLRRVREYIGDEPFHMNYGGGVADI